MSTSSTLSSSKHSWLLPRVTTFMVINGDQLNTNGLCELSTSVFHTRNSTTIDCLSGCKMQPPSSPNSYCRTPPILVHSELAYVSIALGSMILMTPMTSFVLNTSGFPVPWPMRATMILVVNAPGNLATSKISNTPTMILKLPRIPMKHYEVVLILSIKHIFLEEPSFHPTKVRQAFNPIFLADPTSKIQLISHQSPMRFLPSLPVDIAPSRDLK